MKPQDLPIQFGQFIPKFPEQKVGGGVVSDVSSHFLQRVRRASFGELDRKGVGSSAVNPTPTPVSLVSTPTPPPVRRDVDLVLEHR